MAVFGLPPVLPAQIVHAAEAPRLPAANWSPQNHAVLDAWLGTVARRGEGGIATFDWDNTSIFRDIGEATFRYQGEHMAFALSAKQVDALLPERIGEVTHVGGVALADIRADLLEAYTALSTGKAKLGSPEHQDFKAKLMWLYQTLCDAPDVPVTYTYRWLTYWYGGMTPAEVEALGAKVARESLLERIETRELKTATPGRAGHVSAHVECGMTAQPEVKDLMRALTKAGVDVFVVSASVESVVRGAAAALDYPVKPTSIYGMRLALADGKFLPAAAPDYPNVYRQGKVDVIARHLPKKPLVFAAGDANTDVEMLRAAREVRLIMDRHGRGDIGKLADEAVVDRARHDAPSPAHPMTLLQARDETQGTFAPRDRT